MHSVLPFIDFQVEAKDSQVQIRKWKQKPLRFQRIKYYSYFGPLHHGGTCYVTRVHV